MKEKVKRGECCPLCGHYYSRYLAVDSLVVKDDRILMIQRIVGLRGGGLWALPGGYLEWGETTEEAALRELKEETGVKGEIIGLFGVYSDSSRDKLQNVTVVYLVSFIKKILQFDKKEVFQVAWFFKDKLPTRIFSDHREIIEDYFKSREKCK